MIFATRMRSKHSNFEKLHACFSLDMSKEFFWNSNFATFDVNNFSARLQGLGTKSKERRGLSLIKHCYETSVAKW